MRNKLICFLLVLLLAVLALTACGKEDVDKLIDMLQDLPVEVEVTGLEDVSGKASVNLLTETQNASALAAIREVYYLPQDATTYGADIKIVDENGNAVTLTKPVTVSIKIKSAALPLDKYLVFHVHDGRAEQIVPTVNNDKLTVSVNSFSPFIVVPKHEHTFTWTVLTEASGCGEMGIEKGVCACGEEMTRDYELRHDLEYNPQKPATCTEPGEKEYYLCKRCGKFFADESCSREINDHDLAIAALGHIDEDHNQKCDRCGADLGNGHGEDGHGEDGGEGQVNPDGSTHTHTYGEWEILKYASCTTPGFKQRSCTVQGCTVKETATISATGHVDKDGDKKCDVCGAALENASGKPDDESGKPDDESGKPDDESGKPDDESGKPDDETDPKDPESQTPVDIPTTYQKDGNVLYFGAYPQTRMTDETLISALNELAGAFPGRTEDEFNGWTSYKYYRGTNSKDLPPTNEYDFMFYKDVTYNGSTYRGVYMTAYRPNVTIRTGTPDNTFQDDNGYQFRGVSYLLYWFKFEPIQWRILEERDGVALVIAQLIIDSQAYLNVAEYTGLDDHSNEIDMNTNPGVPENTYANNYEYSSIRAWLNDNFYNTAFTALQKELIALTNVDNSINSSRTSYIANDGKTDRVYYWNTGTDFLCGNTEDYVFLPSLAEITNADYGFTPCYTRYAEDTNRIRLYSDYALSQGLWAHSSSYTNGVKYGEYWLRTPQQSDYDGSGYGAVCTVDEEGTAEQSGYVCWTAFGVVPMLRILLAD